MPLALKFQLASLFVFGAALALMPGCASTATSTEGEAPAEGAAAYAAGEEGGGAEPDAEAAAEGVPAASQVDLEAAGVYFEMAEKFLERKDYANATANYRKALELNPEHYESQYKLAESLARQGQNAEAIRLLKDLLERLQYKDNAGEIKRVRNSAEGLLLGLDELGMALSEAAKVITDFGVQAEEADRYENALALYQKALALWPACTEARRRAFQLCKRQKKSFPAELVEAVMQDLYLELTELTPVSTEVKNGEVLFNRTRWSSPLFNGGKSFKRGIWAPAPSKLVYNLDGKYRRLTASLFISAFEGKDSRSNDVLERELSQPHAGTVRFRVTGDGKTLFESDEITYARGVVPLSVELKGIKTLELETLDSDGSDLLDFSVWADARVFMK